jgi:hypothetical protein
MFNTHQPRLGWIAFEQDVEPEATNGLVFLVR